MSKPDAPVFCSGRHAGSTVSSELLERGLNIDGEPIRMRESMDELTNSELLVMFSRIMDTLKGRGVVRSFNNPVADYCETLAAFALNLRLEGNSHKGYDATDNAGIRYQIKGRLIHDTHSLYQLSVIRNLEAREFDFLIAVLLDRNFSVIEAYKIPHSLVAKYSRYSEHQRGNILRLKGKIVEDPGIGRIGSLLQVKLPEQKGDTQSRSARE